MKTICLTFDDGCAEDRAIVTALSEREAKATFYLNSGLMGTSYFHPDLGREVHRIPRDEAAQVYRNQEVGAHTVHHPFLDRLDDEAILAEILDDRQALEALFGVAPSTLALPFGPYPDAFHSHLETLLSGSGFRSMRVGPSQPPSFDPPAGFILRPACSHPKLDAILPAFLADSAARFLCVAGHGYEIADESALSAFRRMLDTALKAGVRIVGLTEALSG